MGWTNKKVTSHHKWDSRKYYTNFFEGYYRTESFISWIPRTSNPTGIRPMCIIGVTMETNHFVKNSCKICSWSTYHGRPDAPATRVLRCGPCPQGRQMMTTPGVCTIAEVFAGLWELKREDTWTAQKESKGRTRKSFFLSNGYLCIEELLI